MSAQTHRRYRIAIAGFLLEWVTFIDELTTLEQFRVHETSGADVASNGIAAQTRRPAASSTFASARMSSWCRSCIRRAAPPLVPRLTRLMTIISSGSSPDWPTLEPSTGCCSISMGQ